MRKLSVYCLIFLFSDILSATDDLFNYDNDFYKQRYPFIFAPKKLDKFDRRSPQYLTENMNMLVPEQKPQYFMPPFELLPVKIKPQEQKPLMYNEQIVPRNIKILDKESIPTGFENYLAPMEKSEVPTIPIENSPDLSLNRGLLESVMHNPLLHSLQNGAVSGLLSLLNSPLLKIPFVKTALTYIVPRVFKFFAESYQWIRKLIKGFLVTFKTNVSIGSGKKEDHHHHHHTHHTHRNKDNRKLDDNKEDDKSDLPTVVKDLMSSFFQFFYPTKENSTDATRDKRSMELDDAFFALLPIALNHLFMN